MKVLFAVSEIDGLIKTGGLADVARNLPTQLQDLGVKASIAIPFYDVIKTALPTPLNTYSFTIASANNLQINVHQYEIFHLEIFCFEVGDYFNRTGIYGENYTAYDDNADRYGFFCLSVIEFLQNFKQQLHLNFELIHCNDWHTALIPFFLKSNEQHLSADDNLGTSVKTVLTIHNGAFQGQFSASEQNKITSLILNKQKHLTISNQEYNQEQKQLNFLSLGINTTDKIIAVSPNYAKELLTPLGSHFLYNDMQNNAEKVTGILNGCDYDAWNPQSDPYIEQNYQEHRLDLKLKNKLALQKSAGFTQSERITTFSLVSRLTEQKGLDYLIPSLEEVLQHNVQIFIAGTGDPKYIDALQLLADKYPAKMFFYHGFSEAIAHTFMVGADVFLVPSLFEPCGLTQMHALAYGTLPLVRNVGGLADTVIDINEEGGTGFVFDKPNVNSMSSALRRAVLFRVEQPNKFHATQVLAMKSKFTWKKSAISYLSVYKELLSS